MQKQSDSLRFPYITNSPPFPISTCSLPSRRLRCRKCHPSVNLPRPTLSLYLLINTTWEDQHINRHKDSACTGKTKLWQHNPTKHSTEQNSTVQHAQHNKKQQNTKQRNKTQNSTKQHRTAQHKTEKHNTTPKTQHRTAQHNPKTQHSTTQPHTTPNSTEQPHTTQHNSTHHKTSKYRTVHHNTRYRISRPFWLILAPEIAPFWRFLGPDRN